MHDVWIKMSVNKEVASITKEAFSKKEPVL